MPTKPTKKDLGLCKSKGCKRKSQGAKVGGLCARHKHLKWKKDHPGTYHFAALKGNAKRRGIEFKLDYEAYVRIWQKSGKWDCRSPKPKGYEMDRIHRLLPYEESNCRILSRTVHLSKTSWERGIDWSVTVFTTPNDILDNCPF